MPKIPYGISNFETLITEGYLYVDKTAYLRELEKAGRYLFFVRPRRFGKSLLVSMLEHYYDAARAPRFDRLFASLAVGREPTALRSKYLVLCLDFAALDTSQPAESLKQAFDRKVLFHVREVFLRYPDVLGDQLPTLSDDAQTALQMLFERARAGGQKLYVLVDEYDNFANALLAHGDVATYRDMLHATGYVRAFYKALKEGTRTVVERMFVTGVTPVMLDDLTSGFNIARNVTLDDRLSDTCGFTSEELRGILDSSTSAVEADALLHEISALYDGYRFCETAEEPLFNADMALHYLLAIQETGKPPRETIDHNVRTDYGRLRALALSRPENMQTIDTILAEERLQQELIPQFGFERMYDTGYFASVLFYLGLLTIEGRPRGRLTFRIPNYGIKTVYWDYFRRLLEERHEVHLRTQDLGDTIEALAWEGDPGPFARYVAEEVLGKLSRRDFRQFGEKHVKAVLFSLLGLTDFYVCHSEVDVEHGFLDLFLSRDPRFPELPYEWLIELKYLKEDERGRLDEVKDQALAQLAKYADSREIRARFRGAVLKMAGLVFVGKGEVQLVLPQGCRRDAADPRSRKLPACGYREGNHSRAARYPQ